MGGEYLLKLNISLSPIAYKYREGKLQRTLKRELKEPEIANGEGLEQIAASGDSSCTAGKNRTAVSCLFVAGGLRKEGGTGILFQAGWIRRDATERGFGRVTMGRFIPFCRTKAGVFRLRTADI